MPSSRDRTVARVKKNNSRRQNGAQNGELVEFLYVLDII